MKLIPLTQGKFAKVDDDDYKNLSQYKWHLQRDRVAARCLKVNGHDTCPLMHREIMHTPDGMHTDHIDHDPLNNCKSNLRICTPSQNHGNSRLAKNNTSGFKGVAFYKPLNKWRAHIHSQKKTIHIGYFDTQEEAAKAYDEAAVEIFGEFAFTNFGTDGRG